MVYEVRTIIPPCFSEQNRTDGREAESREQPPVFLWSVRGVRGSVFLNEYNLRPCTVGGRQETIARCRQTKVSVWVGACWTYEFGVATASFRVFVGFGRGNDGVLD
jgi:hypothetical protein